jgi:hypothetical protein
MLTFEGTQHLGAPSIAEKLTVRHAPSQVKAARLLIFIRAESPVPKGHASVCPT